MPKPGSTVPGSSSSPLIDAARQADVRAWSKLVALYGPLVYHWCRESGLSPVNAADLVPGVFRAVLVGLKSEDQAARTGTFRDWLRELTHQQLIEQGQPVAADRMEYDTPDLGAPSGSLSVSAGVVLPNAVLISLEQLRLEVEDRTWQCFWKTVVDGHPAIEVAAELGIAPDVVYRDRARLMRLLRQQIMATL